MVISFQLVCLRVSLSARICRRGQGFSCRCDRYATAANEQRLSVPRHALSPPVSPCKRHLSQTTSAASASTCSWCLSFPPFLIHFCKFLQKYYIFCIYANKKRKIAPKSDFSFQWGEGRCFRSLLYRKGRNHSARYSMLVILPA